MKTMKKIQEKFVTAARRLSDIFIKFLEIYQIRIISNVFFKKQYELKRLCKMSK